MVAPMYSSYGPAQGPRPGDPFDDDDRDDDFLGSTYHNPSPWRDDGDDVAAALLSFWLSPLCPKHAVMVDRWLSSQQEWRTAPFALSWRWATARKWYYSRHSRWHTYVPVLLNTLARRFARPAAQRRVLLLDFEFWAGLSRHRFKVNESREARVFKSFHGVVYSGSLSDYDHIVFPVWYENAWLTMMVDRRSGILAVYDPCGVSARAPKRLGVQWGPDWCKLRDICVKVFAMADKVPGEDQCVQVHVPTPPARPRDSVALTSAAMEVFAYGGVDPGTIKAFLHLTERITRGCTTADILSHLPQTSAGRPLSYLSICSDSPLLANTWSQAASTIAGAGGLAVPPPSSSRRRLTPSTTGLAPSLASSRRCSSHEGWPMRAASGMLSERTLEHGDRASELWIKPEFADEPESEADGESEDRYRQRDRDRGRDRRAQSDSRPPAMRKEVRKEVKKAEEDKGTKKRSFWPFKFMRKKPEPELKVHGPVRDLLDRAVWTMQTGHRATGMACCHECCNCGY